jgi:hypothetical protein
MLEIAETSEMKTGQNGHYFTVRHLMRTVTMLFIIVGEHLMFFEFPVKFFAKIVCNTENLFMHNFYFMVFMIRFA